MKYKKNQLAVAIAASFSASLAFAQTQPAASTTIERVEVTGSNIKRTSTETASPISVITRADIERSGATTLGELLRRVPGNNAGSLNDVGAVASFGQGAASISLRGLGGRATLVLVNGRRVAPYGFGSFSETVVDVNALPTDVIDRVEILKDGASAIYGSDAIAGVVNVILRKDFVGGSVSAGFGAAEDGEAQRYRVSATAGYGDLGKDRYNGFLNFTYSSQDEMRLSARANSDFRSIGYVNRQSSFSSPGNFFTYNPATGGTFLRQNGACASQYVAANGACLIDTNDWTTNIPKASDVNVFGRFNWEISPSLSLFTELGVSQRKLTYNLEPQFYTNDDNGFGIVFAPDDPRNPTGQRAFLRYRAGDIGARTVDLTSDVARALVGLKGSLASGWDWEVGFLQSETKGKARSTGNIITAEMEAALANGFVPGNRAANGEAVYSKISQPLSNSGKATMSSVDAKLSGEVMQLPAGPLSLAFGTEYRREKFNENPDLKLQQGLVFGSVANATADSRNVVAVFAEARVPILKTLEAELAIRADKYSGIERSVTPKAGLKWTVTPDWVVRGTYAEGFSAPTFQARSDGQNRYFTTIVDPVYCLTGDEPECSWPIAGSSGGNKALKPETSKSFTLGSVYAPSSAFSVSMDYYSIKRKNEISTLDVNYLLVNPSQYPGFVVRNADGRVVSVRTPFVNIAATETSGLDLDLRIKRDLESGVFRAGVTGNYVMTWDSEEVPGAGLLNYNGTYNQPRYRHTVFAEYETGPYVGRLTQNQVGGFSYNLGPGQACPRAQFEGGCEVKAWGTLDLYLGYKGIRNLTIGLAVNNLEDRGPARDFRAMDSQFRRYNASYHSIVGRTYFLSAAYKFK